MFRHRGKSRTLKHNLKIASLLSFVAGMVNVAGFLSVQRLTTNVTGHFAFFVDEVFKFNLAGGCIYLMYIVSFFLGSFVSNFIIEVISAKTERFIFVFPVTMEIMILTVLAFLNRGYVSNHSDLIACSLLFAMGLQNSLVTRISNAMVRTTHLTGLFTDLGIEMSQLFFYTTVEQRYKLLASIKLRMRIISFFFIGGITGGVFYSRMELKVLFVAAMLLISGLVYDSVRIKLILLKKRLSHII